MALDRHLPGFCLRASIQMGAEENVERQAGEVFDGKQEVAGWQVLAGFPVSPCAGGDAKLPGNVRDLEVFSQTPVLESHAERNTGRVMMVMIFGVHCGGEGTRSMDRLITGL